MTGTEKRPVALGFQAFIITKGGKRILLPKTEYVISSISADTPLRDGRFEFASLQTIKLFCLQSPKLRHIISLHKDDISKILISADFAGIEIAFETLVFYVIEHDISNFPYVVLNFVVCGMEVKKEANGD